VVRAIDRAPTRTDGEPLDVLVIGAGHEGERPVAFTWRLRTPMPEELFEVARSVAAA
jgi:hypothetical protein